MAIDAMKAVQAYEDAARIAGAAPAANAAAEIARPNFAGLVEQAFSGTQGALAGGEAAGAAVAAGEASLVDVVTAISAAEVALETAIAVRNRVIEAYQEIMRMPI